MASTSSARVIICGDMHLRPHDRGAFLMFLADLGQRPAAHLVILGDLFEYWLDGPVAQRAYQGLFVRLQALHQQGWHIHLVPGNRELAGGGYLRTAVPWHVHPHSCDVHCYGKRLRIVHGDRLVRDPGYRFMVAHLKGWWCMAWRRCLPLSLQVFIARSLRAFSRRKQRRVSELGAALSLLDPRRVQAAAVHCDTLIAGHIHQQLQRHIRGIEFVLCGHWEADHGSWVEVDAAGHITLCKQSWSLNAAG
ncbi:MAG: hypothetical protein EA401_05785 [Planctomycetota bacterium]|nr:MAG: hypothetical protein EA401_05785 [Planctomycetota bacterium]